MSSTDEEDAHVDLFKDPTDYYQTEKPPTFVKYETQAGQHLSLRLVGQSPLWGHLLWNAAQVVTTHLEINADRMVKGKNVLELGAGAGLPSIVCAIRDARRVVVTDYPEPKLVENLQYNIDHCDYLAERTNINARGYLWGSAIDSLVDYLETSSDLFDLVILADILFNHSEHHKLIDTLCQTLKKTRDAVAVVFFTPYRPWLLEKDLHFFELARARGFKVDEVSKTVMEKLMFDDDPGDELLRRTVFGYEVRWQNLP